MMSVRRLATLAVAIAAVVVLAPPARAAGQKQKHHFVALVSATKVKAHATTTSSTQQTNQRLFNQYSTIVLNQLEAEKVAGVLQLESDFTVLNSLLAGKAISTDAYLGTVTQLSENYQYTLNTEVSIAVGTLVSLGNQLGLIPGTPTR